jgi:hypothetical protein
MKPFLSLSMIQTGRMPRLLLSFLPFLYLAAVLLPLPTKALYSARSDVVQLTEENFKVGKGAWPM